MPPLHAWPAPVDPYLARPRARSALSSPRETPIEPTVTAIIPAYRDPAALTAAVRALLASEGVAADVVVVNNDPGTPLAPCFAGQPRVQFIEAGANTGYAGAMNRGLALARGEFVLLANQDLLVEPAFAATLAAFMAGHPLAGAVSGRVLRPPAREGQHPRVDSAGIALRRDRGSYDRGEGEPDRGQFARTEQVFGVSGAALFARRAALDDVALPAGCFPESFFMYKEDVDLCWRLRQRGSQCWYVPAAVAYHPRTGRGLGGRGYFGTARTYLANERAKPAYVRLHSLKNQWLMLVRNESAGDLLRDFPRILAREALAVGANLAVSPPTLARSLAAFGRALPEALRDRRAIRARRTAGRAALRPWLTGELPR